MTVSVNDRKTGDAFDVEVGPGENAMDVFHHPFAYAPIRKVVLAPTR